VKQDTIPNGTALGSGIQCEALRIQGILMPAAWTAAGLSFKVSLNGTTWFYLYDSSGAAITLTTAANYYHALTFDQRKQLANWQYIMPASGTPAVPVAQGADRVITFILG
jgi:hypothetical protein